MTYGNCARPWPSILRFYDECAAGNPAFANLAQLAHQIGNSGFPEAGLHGVTSVHDLLLGPSDSVLDNPFLRITYDFAKGHFLLTYQPGGDRMATNEPRWSRAVRPEHAWPAIERFITRRARWYRQRT